MGMEDKAALQKLLDSYAAAELRVRHAIGDRHDAMYAVVDWVTAFTEREIAERVPKATTSATGDVPKGTSTS